MMHKPFEGPLSEDEMRTAFRLLGIGWYVAICLLGGTAVGLWLDSRFETSPVFMLIGLFAGLALAGIGMYRLLMAVLASEQNGKGES